MLICNNFSTHLQRLEILIYYSLQTSGTPNTDQLLNYSNSEKDSNIIFRGIEKSRS